MFANTFSNYPMNKGSVPNFLGGCLVRIMKTICWKTHVRKGE